MFSKIDRKKKKNTDSVLAHGVCKFLIDTRNLERERLSWVLLGIKGSVVYLAVLAVLGYDNI